jgi:hypothetical protein
MELHFTEEWLRKKILESGDDECEAGGLLAVSPELYEKLLMSNHIDHEITSLLDVYTAQLKRTHEELSEQLIGKKYKIISTHIERKNGENVEYKDTFHYVAHVSWNSHTGFAVRSDDHRVYVHISDVEFIKWS